VPTDTTNQQLDYAFQKILKLSNLCLQQRFLLTSAHEFFGASLDMFDGSLNFPSNLLFKRLHLLFEYVCVAIAAFPLSGCSGCLLLLSGSLLLLGAFAGRTVVVTGGL